MYIQKFVLLKHIYLLIFMCHVIVLCGACGVFTTHHLNLIIIFCNSVLWGISLVCRAKIGSFEKFSHWNEAGATHEIVTKTLQIPMKKIWYRNFLKFTCNNPPSSCKYDKAVIIVYFQFSPAVKKLYVHSLERYTGTMLVGSSFHIFK